MRVGLRIQKGDRVSIKADVNQSEFVRVLTEAAYLTGAEAVNVDYGDLQLTRLALEHASDQYLEEVDSFLVQRRSSHLDKRYKFISVTGTDPRGLEGCDPQRFARASRASAEAMQHISKRLMANECSWCVVAAASPEWAKAIFPDLESEEAVQKLWDLIFYTVRVNEADPVAAWDTHMNRLKKRAAWINAQKFQSLKYRSAKGTDLRVGLPEKYHFLAAIEENQSGEWFVPNMPTEEVFSMPHRLKVDGVVYSTKALNYGGNLIDEFKLTIRDGEVVDCEAETGEEILKNLLDTDPGARRFGEVALVPYHSPISLTDTLFYNTLFDENASCHLALGRAYPTTMEGGVEMSEEELKEAGANDSFIHVDFMIGDETLEIDGEKADGSLVPLFRAGDFVPEVDA